MRFLQTGADTSGAMLQIESVNPPTAVPEPMHIHPHQLADRGELDERGMPSLLRLATLAPEFADEIRVVKPPWPVQRLVFSLLAPIARMRGFATVGAGTAEVFHTLGSPGEQEVSPPSRRE